MNPTFWFTFPCSTTFKKIYIYKELSLYNRTFFLFKLPCIRTCVRVHMCACVCVEVSVAMVCCDSLFLQCEFQGSNSSPWSLGFKCHCMRNHLTSPSNASFNGLLGWYQCTCAIVGGSLFRSEQPSLKFSIQGQMR